MAGGGICVDLCWVCGALLGGCVCVCVCMRMCVWTSSDLVPLAPPWRCTCALQHTHTHTHTHTHRPWCQGRASSTQGRPVVWLDVNICANSMRKACMFVYVTWQSSRPMPSPIFWSTHRSGQIFRQNSSLCVMMTTPPSYLRGGRDIIMSAQSIENAFLTEQRKLRARTHTHQQTHLTR